MQDLYRIPSLIMNAKDYNLNNTSFEVMGTNYIQQLQINSPDLGNFYTDKYDLGNLLKYQYSEPLCNNAKIREILTKKQAGNCSDFF